MRFIAIEEGKWRCLSRAVRGGVVVEFSGRKELYPFSWIVGIEDVKTCLKLLIGSFSLSISLWVIAVES